MDPPSALSFDEDGDVIRDARAQCTCPRWCRRHDAPLVGPDMRDFPHSRVFATGPFSGQNLVPRLDRDGHPCVDRFGYLIADNGRDALQGLDEYSRRVIMDAVHAARPWAVQTSVTREGIVNLARLVDRQRRSR